jgi:hypothetical protein
VEFFSRGIDVEKTALLDGKQSRDGTQWKAMFLARQPNIDLSLAQNAPINDLHLLLLCLYVSPFHFISPTSLLQRGSTLALSQCRSYGTRGEVRLHYSNRRLISDDVD